MGCCSLNVKSLLGSPTSVSAVFVIVLLYFYEERHKMSKIIPNVNTVMSTFAEERKTSLDHLLNFEFFTFCAHIFTSLLFVDNCTK